MESTLRRFARACGRSRIRASRVRRSSFFKTSPGDYGYGDRFLGIRVPTLRRSRASFVARRFRLRSCCCARRCTRSGCSPCSCSSTQFARGTETMQQRIYQDIATRAAARQQLGSRRLVGALHRRRASRGARPRRSLRASALAASVVAARRDHRNLLVHQARLFRRRAAIAELLLRRRAGSDPQGRRLDAARSRQPQPRRRGALPAAPLPAACRARCCATRSRSSPSATRRAYLPARFASGASTRS